MSHAYVSLHDLTGASVRSAFFRHDDGKRVGVILDDGTQLHWASLDDFEAFVDTLYAKVIEAAVVTVTS